MFGCAVSSEAAPADASPREPDQQPRLPVTIRDPGPDNGYFPNVPDVLPPGGVYLESALALDKTGGPSTRTYTVPLLFRAGIVEDWELQLAVDAIAHEDASGANTTGSGPIWREEMGDLWSSDVEPVRPERLCKELTDHLPSNAILVSDTGHAGIWTGTMIDFSDPGQSFIRCSGSLGWGLPAALGAKCAAPDRPVLCFTGDGGIWYHIAELETAVRCDIPAVIVVNNNHSLNQEQGGVEKTYGGRTAGSDELWLFEDTDFAKVAESMGALGITVNKASEISGALDQAFSSGRPTVVDVKTHVEGISPPTWMPK